MSQVRDGEIAKLGVLFERHHRRLFGFCLRLTGDRQSAEDLVQDVFARLLRYRHTFRADSDFLVWVFQIARNARADLYRRQGKRLEAEEPLDEIVHEPTSSRPLPTEELESAESAALLRRALSSLPVDKRELLVMARFQNLKYEQIAQVYGCTVGAVKVRVHRAVRQLRDAYIQIADGVLPEAVSEATS